MYKKLFSETIIYGIGSVLPRVLNFLLIKFITKPIGAAEFSIYTQLYALASFINVVLQFGFETSYFRFAKDKQHEKKVFSTAFLFMLGTSSIFLIIVYLFDGFIVKTLDYHNNPEYIKWFAWFIFFDTLCVVPFARLRFNNKPLYYTIVKIANSFVYLGLVLYFLHIIVNVPYNFLGFQINEKLGFVFIANFFSSLATLFLLYKVFHHFRLKFDVDLFKTMMKFSFPIMLAGIAYTLNENFDKMVQRTLIDEVSAGAYGACYKLTALMSIFVMAFRMGVEPFFFKQMYTSNAKEKYAKITEVFVIVSGLIVVGLLANINWIKDFFLKRPEYNTAMAIVPIVVIANMFFGIYNTLSVWYKVSDKTFVGSMISWFAAILTLVLNIILLPIVGYMASAWVTLLAYGSMMIISYFLSRKYYPIPFKIRKIIMYMLTAILLGIISYYGFKNNYIVSNLMVILYIVIFYFLEKNVLLKEILRK